MYVYSFLREKRPRYIFRNKIEKENRTTGQGEEMRPSKTLASCGDVGGECSTSWPMGCK
jgi:hypothetical protein